MFLILHFKQKSGFRVGMSIQSFTNILTLGAKSVGQFVHIYHDAFVHNVANNVLGRYDDHNVGKIIDIKDGCAYVQYGSEANIGIYDVQSLAALTVSLKSTSANKTGTLGVPTENRKGYILEWSNFGKGDTVKVREAGLLFPPSTYNVSDLIFTISDSMHSSVTLVRKGGSNHRVTLRKKKLPSFYTRLLKRV
jgi:hypothetical protein